MSDTTPVVETVAPEAPKNDVNPVVTPPVVTAADTVTEELRKQLEQAKMRENQLANQLKAKEEAEAKAKEKELEENNQFKDLFEQEKAKREALEAEQETNQRQAELNKTKAEALNGFSEDVKKLAEEVGIELLDTDEQSVEAFKGKLDKISATASAEARITPNNPNQPDSKIELTPQQLQEAMYGDKDGTVFHELIMKQFPGIASMTKAKK